MSCRLFIIETEQDAKKMAEQHATAKGELLFTTYSFSHRQSYSYDAIYWATHMWANLNETGILNHTIVLSYDVHSCQVMWEHGIPCFLDRFLPQPSSLPGEHSPVFWQYIPTSVITGRMQYSFMAGVHNYMLCICRTIWIGGATLVPEVCMGA